MALCVAILCITSYMIIPLPFTPIVIGLQTIMINLIALLFRPKEAGKTILIYLLMGLIGLPVFSGYSGGPGKILGPTGGYLVGFFLMAIVCGIFIKKFPKNYILIFLGMVAGTALAYLFGTVWFVIEMECTVAYALTVCVIPFILGDLIKI